MSSAILAFLLASFILAIIPGPGVIYLIARTLSHGRRAGFQSVLGVALGNLCNALAASFGVAMLLGARPSALVLLRCAGAAYLLYLAIQAFRRARTTLMEEGLPGSAISTRFVRDGFLVAALNPKVMLFFAAYVPLFIPPGISPAVAAPLLSVAFVLLAFCTDSLYVLLAGSAGRKLTGRRRGLAIFEGLIFLALAVYSVV